MELIKVKTNLRENTGKGISKALRRDNIVPAILYGKSTEPVTLMVGKDQIDLAIKQSETQQIFVEMVSDAPSLSGKSAMIKEMQIHPLTEEYIHVDFLEIDMETKIKVKVPVVTTGLSIGVDTQNGLLQIIRRELEVFCKPGNVPSSIEVDVTELETGKSIHVSEINVEGDFEIPYDVDFTVITVLIPKGTSDEDEESEDLDGEEGTEEDAKEEDATASE